MQNAIFRPPSVNESEASNQHLKSKEENDDEEKEEEN